ncbi:MAG TPA: hypothetical protein PLG14_07570 [Spirochaetales bacterium]|nr:hypothetical protein [Spirochaetales bacterium]
MRTVRSRPRPAKSGALAAASLLAAAFSFLLPGCARPGPRPPETLVSKDGAYIVVIHEGVEAEEAKSVLEALEAQAPRIKADLGVSDPVPYSVHLRGSVGEYLEVMRGLIGGVFPGSTGYAAGRHRAEILLTPLAAQDAVHEYAHSVSLAWARNWHNKPRWLWEAVALYEAGELVDPRSLPYLSEGEFPSLAELDEDYNSSDHRIYEVGYLLLDFLRARWGMEKVKELVRSTGDIEGVLGVAEEDFERDWAAFVRKKYL